MIKPYCEVSNELQSIGIDCDTVNCPSTTAHYFVIQIQHSSYLHPSFPLKSKVIAVCEYHARPYIHHKNEELTFDEYETIRLLED
jgi:hypothetical protein